MEFIKRHWFKLTLIILFLAMLIIGVFAVLKFLYPDSRKDEYGNRLIGIEDVVIEDKTVDEIKDKISANEFVTKVSYILKGKLINFTIEVVQNTDKNTAKTLVNNITEVFNTEIKEFYDIQVLIIEKQEKTEEETEKNSNYPIFAYKHKTSKNFVWTNN